MFWNGCNREIERRSTAPPASRPPTVRIGSFEYNRPYSSEELADMAEDFCREEALGRGVEYGSLRADFRTTEPDNRYWMFCEVFSAQNERRPAFTLWLKQDKIGDSFTWSRYEDSDVPAPQ